MLTGYVRDQLFFCERLEKKTTKNGKPFLDVSLVHVTGSYIGRVWDEAMPKVGLEAGKVVVLTGNITEYQGKPQIDIKLAEVTSENPESILGEVIGTPTLVFDIETAGYDFSDLDADSQVYLIDRLQKADTEEKRQDARTATGLYPLFGEVVAIGLLDTRQKGCVLLISDKPVGMTDQRFTCEVFGDEASLLRRFWEITKKYQRFVTYNGKGFDWPYLVFRSGVRKVAAAVPPLAWQGRDTSIDLMKEIGLSRNYTLAEVTKAMGTFNPKAEGVDGSDVTTLMDKGKQDLVAQYVARDVVATGELYDVWRQYMAGRVVV